MSEKRKITRRQFLQIVAVSGLAGLAVKLGLDDLAAGEMVSETRLLMGTVINIKAVGRDPETASAAVSACLERMAALEAVLSRFQPDSQLARLNRVGSLREAHPALVSLIRQSQQLSELTGGAFDITVKPLLDLYRPGASLPGEAQIRQALALVDYRKIDLSGRTARLQQPGMCITLDGIAKGFIVDEGAAVLQRCGFENVLVEAGGDLVGLGARSPQSPWKVGLQAPRREPGSLMATFDIRDRAVATSGDYMQAFAPDFSSHHILDPRSGRSSPELASASVTAPNAGLADGLATAVMVMGRAGLRLIEGLPDCEALAVTKEAAVLKTSGFQEG